LVCSIGENNGFTNHVYIELSVFISGFFFPRGEKWKLLGFKGRIELNFFLISIANLRDALAIVRQCWVGASKNAVQLVCTGSY